MGTNFYIRGQGQSCEFHLGKRSAAGLYCWDCGISLCKEGNKEIHGQGTWHDKCPVCGKLPRKETLSTSSGGRELGFNSDAQCKQGVTSVCSFSWAVRWDVMAVKIKEMHPLKCHACQRVLEDPLKVIEDEYGRSFTFEEFIRIVEDCPIHFDDMIGVEFC